MPYYKPIIYHQMKLYEFEGKRLFEKYGVPTPQGSVLESPESQITTSGPYVLKAQMLSGDRKKKGGIVFAETELAAREDLRGLFSQTINGETITLVMVEKKIPIAAEYYISLSYDTDARGPVLALSKDGGSGITRAHIFPVNPIDGLSAPGLHTILATSDFPPEDTHDLAAILQNLWKLFERENALLAEINPLIKTPDGKFIAADAKIILDDEKVRPGERRFIEMDGDIAILASGGGASLLSIDALLLAGGKPANYTEYSGNPSAEVVAKLSHRVLAQKNLIGCWVVGGTANFTDIYETMRGFVDGLRQVQPKPTYPIVIRRDGPRQKEAFALLKKVALEEGYDLHVYGSETTITESARILTKLAYGKKK